MGSSHRTRRVLLKTRQAPTRSRYHYIHNMPCHDDALASYLFLSLLIYSVGMADTKRVYLPVIYVLPNLFPSQAMDKLQKLIKDLRTVHDSDVDTSAQLVSFILGNVNGSSSAKAGGNADEQTLRQRYGI